MFWRISNAQHMTKLATIMTTYLIYHLIFYNYLNLSFFWLICFFLPLLFSHLFWLICFFSLFFSNIFLVYLFLLRFVFCVWCCLLRFHLGWVVFTFIVFSSRYLFLLICFFIVFCFCCCLLRFHLGWVVAETLLCLSSTFHMSSFHKR